MDLQNTFLHLCSLLHGPWTGVVFLCIGTHHVTGDGLGPLTGTLLHRLTEGRAAVYGTLQHPLHACNLDAQMQCIKKKHPGALLVAIDASLGRSSSIGYITVASDSLLPGCGMGKILPAVGHVAVTGIVGPQNGHPYRVLRRTPLFRTALLARQIAQGLRDVWHMPPVPAAWEVCDNAPQIHRIRRTYP